MTPPGRPGKAAALVVGGSVSFFVAVNLVSSIRPALLADPDPAWAVPRLFLWLFLVSAVASSGGLAAGAFFLWSRSGPGRVSPGALPLSPPATVALAATALAAGVFLRSVWLSTLPFPFMGDEVNLIGPTLALSGTWRDFANSIRAIPFGVPDPHEVIGVLYLRLFRGVLEVFGPTITGLRFPSLAGGVLSLVTGTLLGRALLPRGGGALAAAALAGLRWHLILSRNGWHLILVTAMADAATLLLLRSRRTGRALPAVAAGLVLGIAAHFHIAAWVPAAALLAFAAWPARPEEESRTRTRRLLACTTALLLAAAPLFLLRGGRASGYLARTARHNVFLEMRYTKSLLPPFAVAADSLAAPWFLPESAGWIDLPGRSRLGWVIGVPVALALSRALAFPKEELSLLLLLQAGAALAAAVLGGQAGHPHGFRFGYLTTLTAVAAAAGILQIVSSAPPRWRRAAALAAIALVAWSGARAARDALLVWPSARSTFDGYHGEDTLIGRAAARWDSRGSVRVERGLGRSDATVDTVRRFRLDPDWKVRTSSAPQAELRGPPFRRQFRVARPGAQAEAGERLVERVRDGWGREWALVFGRAVRGS
ncbi:MAG: hypothetical protein DMF54_12065 [Acidobacteria bacterium]|nr:MAG: hypothetical protein DMF54_12065 [Acidobacteriota bacterium]